MSISNQETVHEGWLTKSPPTKRIWRARWRRRWFALRQSGELPEQYVLEYFTDRNCRKLKGTINLDECEQVDAGLRFERRKQKYQFMFDVKTPARIYYLAADSETDMNLWVDSICRVCGLKSFSSSEEVVTTTPDYYNCGPGSAVHAPNDPQRMSPTPSTVSGPYIPISECISGLPISSPITPQDITNLMQSYSNDLSPLSPQSIPPSYTESVNQSLNSFDPRFYDSPRRLRPSSVLNLNLTNISQSDSNINNNGQVSYNTSKGKTKTRPPDLVLAATGGSSGHSPTDSESVFTDDEWTHPVPAQGAQGPRPSDSSIENETVPWSVVQRFSRMTVTQQGGASAPPRPPKPVHLQEPHGYLNIDGLDRLLDSCADFNKESESLSPAIGPKTASTIVMDEMYDIPRSHQPCQEPGEVGVIGRHCYTNAAPTTVANNRGPSLVFRYDFSSQDALQNADKKESALKAGSSCSPITPGTPRTPGTPVSVSDSIANITHGSNTSVPNLYCNLNSPVLPDVQGGGDAAAPVVNRCLKPRLVPSPPPNIDRKLKPSTPLNSRVISRHSTLPPGATTSSLLSFGHNTTTHVDSFSLRRPRAAPSPTPPRTEGGSDDDNTGFADDAQIYFYSVGNKLIPLTPPGNLDKLQYLDLDLDTDLTGVTLQQPRSPGPTTVYKTVDFLKTEAFKRTKQTAEASRTEKQQKEMSKE